MTQKSKSVFEIRPVCSPSDLDRCVELQQLTWGEDTRECVPPILLLVNQKVGGVTLGAFAANGDLLGFVFGLTGIREGQLVHWSHMLAVRPDRRRHGVGLALKKAQRDQLLPLGVDRMLWTFDPLEAGNARFNLNTLGASVTEYIAEMYPQTDSDLHRGLTLDRFIVSWPVCESARPAPELSNQTNRLPLLNPSRISEPAGAYKGPLRVAIPSNIQEVKSESLETAYNWRSTTRECFQKYLAAGYRVSDFVWEEDSGCCFYLLALGQL